MYQIEVFKNDSSKFYRFFSKRTFSIYLFIFLISNLILFRSSALVPLSEIKEPVIQFYRSPESPFPSGSEDFNILQASKIQTKKELWYLVNDQLKDRWVRSSDLFIFANDKPEPLNHQTGFIKETTSTLRLNNGWRPSNEIKIGSKVTITSIRSDWSCGFDDDNKSVCVASDKVVLPIDTATKIQTKKGSWFNIKLRKKHFFLTTQNTYIPISKVKGWIPNSNIGFVRNKNTTLASTFQINQTFNLYFGRVQIKHTELKTWNQSKLENHGEIWWQEPSPSVSFKMQTFITTDELQLRNIFSLVTSKTGSNKISIASASGIFISKDGVIWNYLDKFGEENYPVAIGPKNTLIVGDQISFDQGKTFQNFLRWDQIAFQSQHLLHHPPKHLKLVYLRLKNKNTLDIHIDTGYKLLLFDFNTVNNFISLRDSRLVNKE